MSISALMPPKIISIYVEPKVRNQLWFGCSKELLKLLSEVIAYS